MNARLVPGILREILEKTFIYKVILLVCLT
jgi:hypothetical protein